MMCKTFLDDYHDWDLMASVFQWTVRTSAKIFNGMYTPYEVITGMKPRSPIDTLLAQPSCVPRVPTSDYVRNLVRYLKEVHKVVEMYHSKARDDSQRAKYRDLGPGTFLSVGDYCLVRKEPDKGISQRLQQKHHDGIFLVAEVHGDGTEAKAYTLSDLAGQRDNLGFVQPVALERLTPVEMLPLSQPDDDQSTRLSMEVDGAWKTGTITAQSIDGKVYVQFDDSPAGSEQCYDLSQVRYNWLPSKTLDTSDAVSAPT